MLSSRRGVPQLTHAAVGVQGSNAGFSKLMNRLLGVHVDMQRKIFDYFTALQASVSLMISFTPNMMGDHRLLTCATMPGTCQITPKTPAKLQAGLWSCHAPFQAYHPHRSVSGRFIIRSLEQKSKAGLMIQCMCRSITSLRRSALTSMNLRASSHPEASSSTGSMRWVPAACILSCSRVMQASER